MREVMFDVDSLEGTTCGLFNISFLFKVMLVWERTLFSTKLIS